MQMFERLSLLVDAARGLKYLHDRGLVHGDLVRLCFSCGRGGVDPSATLGSISVVGLVQHPEIPG